jgi:hypothetical protein
MDRYKRAIRTLTESAEQIKADQTIPENLKKEFLHINRFLRAEVQKYGEAQKTLKSGYRRPGDILARAHAKGQIQDTKALARNLKRVMDQSERKNIPVIGKEAKEKGLPDRQRS